MRLFRIVNNDKVTDEFVVPCVIERTASQSVPLKRMTPFIFFNFRPDRAREITRTIVDPNFEGFERDFFNTYFVTMTQYDATMPNVKVAFKPESLSNTFGEYMSKLGKTTAPYCRDRKVCTCYFLFQRRC